MAALTFVGCSIDEMEVEGHSNSHAISFGTTADNAQTRGTETTAANLQHFGVSAATTTGGFTSSTTMNFMEKQEVSRESGNTWTYAPTKYWPTDADEQLHFFAYAPYNNSNVVMSDGSTSGIPTVSVSPPNDLADMQDFIAAVALNQNTSSSNHQVDFSFMHEMTRVELAAKVSETVFATDANASVTITDVTLQNGSTDGQLYSSGTYTFPTTAGAHGSWSNMQQYGSALTLASLMTDGGVTIAGTTATSLFNADGNSQDYLFLLPPNGTSGVSAQAMQVKVTYNLTVNNTTKEISQVFFLPVGSLKQGYAYALTFLINLHSTELFANVVNWNTATQKTEIAPTTLANNSNAFIINPTSGSEPYYSIPLDQLKKFWNIKEYVGEGNAVEDILSDKEWVAEVIWQDIPTRVINFVDDWGQPHDNFRGRESTHFNFQLTDAAASNPGNVIIGVREAGKTDEYLWSYHMWITDYNPTQTTYTINDDGEGTVTNGSVYRYTGGLWESVYKDKVIMDRNLGAISVNWDSSVADDSQPGVLYYQFGRPTPLPNNRAIYQIDGKTKVQMKVASTATTVSDGIKHPLTFYKGQDVPNMKTDWIIDNKLMNNYWNGTDSRTEGGIYVKNLLDPSPAGWKIPEDGTWEVFSGKANTSTSGLLGLYAAYADGGFNKGYNLYVHTQGSGATSYYPAVGYRHAENGIIKTPLTLCASATPEDISFSNCLLYDAQGINHSHHNYRGGALCIRCIQE